MIRMPWWPKRRKTDSDHPVRHRPPSHQKCFEQMCTSRDTNLASSDLRMVIMDDDNSRRSSRRVMFDSTTVLPILPGEDISSEPTKISECKKFRLLKKKKDVCKLAELIWGSGPSFHGQDALKFHHLPDEKLMISRVFAMPRTVKPDLYNQSESLTSSDSESHYTATVRSMDTLGMNIRNNLVSTAPPERFSRVRNTSLNIELDDSDEFRAFSPPHRLSKNRRIQMSHSSSLCEPAISPLNLRKSRSRMSSIGSSQPDEYRRECFGSPEDRQVALAVIFTHKQRSFVFQHIPLIEAEMGRLESRISNAAMYTKNFLENVHRAWEEFNMAVCLLFNAPRLRNPVWLSLVEHETDDHILASDFCDQLAGLIERLDTKETNYFLSNVVSTVLMYHMSWVASVAAPHSTNYEQTIHLDRNIFHGTMLNEEMTSTPYNPHIAQFLEISGNVGNIHRSTKTVVCGAGDDAELMSNLLSILSYFIRCSAVHASKNGRESDPLPVYRSFSPEMIGSPGSSTSELSAFSPEKVRLEYPCVPEYVEPPNMLVNSVAKLSTIDTVDFLGRSLLAGPSTAFSPHFVISGLIRDGSNIDKAFERMYDDVRCSYEPMSIQRTISSMSCSQSSSYDLQGPDAVIVIADVTDNSVKVLSSEGVGVAHTPSESIVSMFENFTALHRIGTAPKFLISYLEDTLYSVLGKSLSLVELVSSDPEVPRPSNHISSERVRHVVGCDHSDLRLILNVASVYYPCVLSSVL